MKDLVEDFVADIARARVLDQWQGEPFAHDGQMAGAKQVQGRVRHRGDIPGNQCRIVVRAGKVGTGNQDHLSVHIGRFVIGG